MWYNLEFLFPCTLFSQFSLLFLLYSPLKLSTLTLYQSNLKVLHISPISWIELKIFYLVLEQLKKISRAFLDGCVIRVYS